MLHPPIPNELPTAHAVVQGLRRKEEKRVGFYNAASESARNIY